MKHILSTNKFTKEEIENILSCASKMEEDVLSGKVDKVLKDKIKNPGIPTSRDAR